MLAPMLTVPETQHDNVFLAHLRAGTYPTSWSAEMPQRCSLSSSDSSMDIEPRPETNNAVSMARGSAIDTFTKYDSRAHSTQLCDACSEETCTLDDELILGISIMRASEMTECTP